jgi:hypothetical protein
MDIYHNSLHEKEAFSQAADIDWFFSGISFNKNTKYCGALHLAISLETLCYKYRGALHLKPHKRHYATNISVLCTSNLHTRHFAVKVINLYCTLS